MRGLFFGRGGGFYFVRLENKNPYLGEPRWTTSGWPASRFYDLNTRGTPKILSEFRLYGIKKGITSLSNFCHNISCVTVESKFHRPPPP